MNEVQLEVFPIGQGADSIINVVADSNAQAVLESLGFVYGRQTTLNKTHTRMHHD